MAVKVLRILGKRGRTTVPYALRKELGFQPGDVVSFTLENDCVAVRKETICDLEGKLRSQTPRNRQCHQADKAHCGLRGMR